MQNSGKITIQAKNHFQYLKIINGILELTQTQRLILGAFLDLKEKEPDRNAFSSVAKKIIAKQLGRKDVRTLNNYLKIFRDKKLIVKTDGGYEPIPFLMRSKKLIINVV